MNDYESSQRATCWPHRSDRSIDPLQLLHYSLEMFTGDFTLVSKVLVRVDESSGDETKEDSKSQNDTVSFGQKRDDNNIRRTVSVNVRKDQFKQLYRAEMMSIKKK